MNELTAKIDDIEASLKAHIDQKINGELHDVKLKLKSIVKKVNVLL